MSKAINNRCHLNMASHRFMSFRSKYLILMVFCLTLLVQGGCKQSQNTNESDFEKGSRLFISQNYGDAFPYILKAAEAGDAEAQYGISGMYFMGLGIKQDTSKAIEWCTRAAENGHVPAMGKLGSMYWLGSMGARDCGKAEYWLEKAARNGRSGVFRILIDMYESGLCFKNTEKANYYYDMAMNDKAISDLDLGLIHFFRDGGEVGYKKAVQLIEENAEESMYLAGYALGLAYSKGLGVKKDLEKSYKYYQASASKGNTVAQYCLGLCYFYGKGVNKDAMKAVAWIKKAADVNFVYALSFMGNIYEHGIVVSTNKAIAKQYYESAAKLGDEKAKESLMRLNGLVQ